MNTLGISAFYHDSAAALAINGEIISAAQEEKFTRIKHDPCFPVNAIRYCLREASITLKDIDFIIFYEKPLIKFERLLETYLAFVPKGFRSFQKAIPLWIKEKLFQKNVILQHLKQIDGSPNIEDRILFSEHHLSHAASAFYPSPFSEAAILILDGVGEWTTSSMGVGQRNNIILTKEIQFPHSIGLLYSAFTSYIGFKVNSGEYKVMGLAPYGEAKYKQLIMDYLIDLKEDGSFRLNMDYFNYPIGLTMTNDNFHNLFGGLPRMAEEIITQRDMDIAASIQHVTEEIILRLCKSISKETKQKNLCLAGGVALNCVANSRILRSQVFDKIWVQPAAGDAGGAIGSALLGYHLYGHKPRKVSGSGDFMKGAYLGPSFEQAEIVEQLTMVGAQFDVLRTDEEVVKKTAKILAQGKTIGWFQGRAEFGPRALGNRSILADPRCAEMQKSLNLKIKYRESFRPFAPSILIEDLNEWFDLKRESPYMLFVADVLKKRRILLTKEEANLRGIRKLNLKRSEIPAVTHIDYSARIQTVNKETNPMYHDLLKEFKKLTKCPVLVNTSFNIRGEPIVNSPEDAYRCFLNTELDYLIIGRCILNKDKQDTSLRDLKSYKNRFKLD